MARSVDQRRPVAGRSGAFGVQIRSRRICRSLRFTSGKKHTRIPDPAIAVPPGAERAPLGEVLSLNIARRPRPVSLRSDSACFGVLRRCAAYDAREPRPREALPGLSGTRPATAVPLETVGGVSRVLSSRLISLRHPCLARIGKSSLPLSCSAQISRRSTTTHGTRPHRLQRHSDSRVRG